MNLRKLILESMKQPDWNRYDHCWVDEGDKEKWMSLCKVIYTLIDKEVGEGEEIGLDYMIELVQTAYDLCNIDYEDYRFSPGDIVDQMIRIGLLLRRREPQPTREAWYTLVPGYNFDDPDTFSAML